MAEAGAQAQLNFSVAAEILLILSSGMPKDALDIFQALKAALARQVEAKVAEEVAKAQASLPPLARVHHVVQCKFSFAFNYDTVVAELGMLVAAGKLRRMDGTSEPLYALV